MESKIIQPHKDSKYQIEIFNKIIHTKNSLCIEATAGSGKSTTIMRCLDLIPKANNKIILLAFNRNIAEELRERAPKHVSVSTLHAFGMNAILTWMGKVKFNEDKLFWLAMKMFDKWKVEENKFSYIFRVRKLVDYMRVNMVYSGENDIFDLASKYSLPILSSEVDHAIELLDASNKASYKEIDYTDMIHIPAFKNLKLRKHEYVFLDEAQDTNKAQQVIIRNMIHPTNGRLISVGDRHQCQPSGTKILMWDGAEKNIEELVVGDRLVSYNTSSAEFVGWSFKYNKTRPQICKQVKEIASRNFSGNLIEINSNGKTSRYTPNHRCIVKFNDDLIDINTTCVYLMQKGNYFRIGQTKLKHSCGYGLGFRARKEQADKLWILKICSTKSEAFFWEQVLSAKFGIPQLCFEAVESNTFFGNKEMVEKFFSEFGASLIDRGRECLQYFNLYEDCPFYNIVREKPQGNRNSSVAYFETFASNINSEYMLVPHFNNDIKINWHKIDELNLIPFDGKVYSLRIDKYERYVADGILTHNSIYGFAGADSVAFDSLADIRQDTISLPLSICYRCAKAIVREAQKYCPTIEENPLQIDGVVRDGSPKEISGDCFVLCRNTKPLVEMLFFLLSRGIKSNIKGKEIGDNIVSFIKKTKQKTTKNLLKHFEVNRIRLNRELEEKGVKNPRNHPSMVDYSEKCAIVAIMAQKFDTCNQLNKYIESVFLDEEVEGVTLSTIHKMKGAEKKKVFFLNPELIPSQYAYTEEEKQQEVNLSFVATTRAKEELIHIRNFTYNPIDVDKTLLLNK